MIHPTNPYEQHHEVDYMAWRGFEHGVQAMYALIMQDLSFHEMQAERRGEYQVQTWLGWVMEMYAEEHHVVVNDG